MPKKGVEDSRKLIATAINLYIGSARSNKLLAEFHNSIVVLLTKPAFHCGKVRIKNGYIKEV